MENISNLAIQTERMKTKNIIAFIFIACFSLACAPKKITEAELEKIKQEVIDIDLEFSSFSKENGFAKALAKYAADDAIKLNPRQYAAFGKTQLQKEADADSTSSSEESLTWQPKKVHVSASGDLAAAFGDWYFNFKSPRTNNDTIVYGNYLTVWKKQADGTWKYVFDGGNAVPGPTTEEMLALVK